MMTNQKRWKEPGDRSPRLVRAVGLRGSSYGPAGPVTHIVYCDGEPISQSVIPKTKVIQHHKKRIKRVKVLQTVMPSPAEIEAAKNAKGGWTRYQLALWGVKWPPNEGWRQMLEDSYEAHQAKQHDAKKLISDLPPWAAPSETKQPTRELTRIVLIKPKLQRPTLAQLEARAWSPEQLARWGIKWPPPLRWREGLVARWEAKDTGRKKISKQHPPANYSTTITRRNHGR